MQKFRTIVEVILKTLCCELQLQPNRVRQKAKFDKMSSGIHCLKGDTVNKAVFSLWVHNDHEMWNSPNCCFGVFSFHKTHVILQAVRICCLILCHIKSYSSPRQMHSLTQPSYFLCHSCCFTCEISHILHTLNFYVSDWFNRLFFWKLAHILNSLQ